MVFDDPKVGVRTLIEVVGMVQVFFRLLCCLHGPCEYLVHLTIVVIGIEADQLLTTCQANNFGDTRVLVRAFFFCRP